MLSSGHKPTSLGEFPPDWEEFCIGDRNPFVTSGSRGWAKYYAASGDLFVRITNMSREAIALDLADACFVCLPDEEHEGARTQLSAGDMLVSITADIGIISYVDDSVPSPAYINQHIALVRFPGDQIDPRFAAYFLARGPGQQTFRAITDQGAKAGINLKTVRAVPIVAPSEVQEQRAIAEALGDVDALLSGLDRLIAKKRDFKQAAMQQLLTGQTRLPGFAGAWEFTRLGDMARVQRGASPRPIDSPMWFDSNSAVGWVRISDVTCAGMYLRETAQRLSPLGVQQSRPVPSGSLIMSICATVGRPVITSIDVCIHDGFVVFDELKADKFFAYYLLKWIEPRWSKQGQTGSQMNLNTALINGTPVNLPARSEQSAIATVLSDMDAEIDALEARRAKTRDLKQGMMQALLTGRIRLV